MKDLIVAAACVQSRLADFEANLDRVAVQAGLAARAGAGLVLFPEACLTGYGVGPEVSEAALGLRSRLLSRAGQLAADLGLALVVGLMERRRAGLCLTQVAFGPRGRVLGLYRKIHLGPTEADRFRAGQEPGLFEHGGARFGLQLCYDGHFPELSGLQAGRGAEALLIAHASPRRESPEEKAQRWLRYLPARAYDNTAYLAACNPVADNGQGLSFAGVALILGPKGETLASYTGRRPGLALAELKAEPLRRIRASRMGFFRASRRPELYRKLSGPDEP